MSKYDPTPTTANFDRQMWKYAYPTPPPGSVIYTAADQLVTYEEYDGVPVTRTLTSMVVPVSTSYYDAALGALYSEAAEAWSIVNNQAVVTSAVPANETSPSSTFLAAGATQTSVIGQATTEETPSKPTSSHKGGAVAGVLVTFVLLAAGLGAWLWLRKRRTGKSFSLGNVCAGARRRHFDMEERAERDMAETPNSAYSLNTGRSTNDLLEPSSPAVSLASNTNPFLDSTSNFSDMQPLSRSSAARSGSIRSFTSSSLGSSVSQRGGAGETESVVDSQESGSVFGAPSISIASTRSSQRPIHSEGPYPLPTARSPGGASFLASMARSRAHRLPHNPLVDEKFLGPKDRGLVGSEAGDSFDWRRCSFATDEERAMWIKAKSEGSVASGGSRRRSSVDSRYLQANNEAAVGKRTSWRSIGMHSFATADERAMWLRASSSREAASSRASVSTHASNAWSSGEQSEEQTWQGNGAYSRSTSSGTSSEQPSSLPTPANVYPRPSLGINTDLKRHRSHQPSPLSSSTDPFASDLSGVAIQDADPFADQSPSPHSGIGFA